jgi:hypothetical protein
MSKRINHDDEARQVADWAENYERLELAEEERPAPDPSIFDGPYDPAIAMHLLLENYREVAKAQSIWKASAAETKDLKDAYEELIERQNALLEGFEKQKQESIQPKLKTLDDDE